MGISIKTAGGICIGGIVGFYLINKALNFTRQSISEITEASKWKAYYKNGHMGKMIPPGYSEMPVPGQEDREYVHPDVASKRKREEEAAQRQANREANRKPMDQKAIDSITDSLERIAKAYFKTKGIDLDLKKNQQNNMCRYTDYYRNENDIHAVPVVVEGDTDGDEYASEESIHKGTVAEMTDHHDEAAVEAVPIDTENENDITEE